MMAHVLCGKQGLTQGAGWECMHLTLGEDTSFICCQRLVWHSPCQRTHLGCNSVSHVSACWLTGLGLSTLSRYLARTINWNACKIPLLILSRTGLCLQMGFFNIVGIPLFKTMVELFEDAQPMLDGVLTNFRHWEAGTADV